MPPQVALLLGIVLVVYAFRSQRKRGIASDSALFWPTLWYLAAAARPVGFWLYLWGLPLPGGSGTDATDGSLVDRWFYLALTLIGLWALRKRHFRWGPVLRANPWCTVFLIYMAISIVWSDFAFVSFKRYIKVLGCLVMTMIVLTDERPLEAIFTVLRRSLFIHLPMSIICIRYFRPIGVSFDWAGSAVSWQGIATSKNVLGQVVMLGVVYFFWEVMRHWRREGPRNIYFLYLMMAVYLLKGSDAAVSMTSLSVCAFAVMIFLCIQFFRSRPERVRPLVITMFAGVVGLIGFVLLHSIVHFQEKSIFGHMVTLLGRDITMTGRTEIWSDVYDAASKSPIFGVGFGGFWIGRLANIPWNAQMTWVLGQGHSGYVDNYLQLGLVGSFLLAAMMFATLPKLFRALRENFDFGCFRITLFLTILFVNITESVYLRGEHHLWFILQLVLWTVPTAVLPPQPVVEEPEEAVVLEPER